MQFKKLGIAAVVCLAVVVGITVGLQAQAEPNGAARVSEHPDFDDSASGSWATDASQGLSILSFDDGSYETGIGVGGGAGYDGVVGQRFGGSPATTGVVPLGIRGAYWRFFGGGFAGATQVQINFWHPLAGAAPRLPVNPTPIAGVAGNTNTTATQFASTPAGPAISTANGSVIAGVNVLGVSSWFVAGDTSSDDGRQYFGTGPTLSQAPTIGAVTLGFPFNLLIRLLVDGNIPVELETFNVESVE